jgi:transmembrane sensor
MNTAQDIDRQASEWLARLEHGELPVEQQLALAQWRASDARHEAAFVRLDAISRRMDRLAVLRPVGANVQPDPDLLLPRAPSSSVYRSRRAVAAAIGGLAVAATVAIAMVLSPGTGRWFDRQSVDEHFHTALGGFERTLLPDGSVMQLNTSSDAHVRFNGEQRVVELRAGEATFEVAKDRSRPFLVKAGDVIVRAVGTVFTVRLRPAATEVLVTEGRVAVGQQAEKAAEVSPNMVPVQAGQAAMADRRSVSTRALSRDESSRELAWHSGMLAFDNDRLADIVAQFNRYNQKHLEIADEQLAEYRMGGYFRATNLDTFIGVLEREYGIRAVEGPDGVLRLESAPAD